MLGGRVWRHLRFDFIIFILFIEGGEVDMIGWEIR